MLLQRAETPREAGDRSFGSGVEGSGEQGQLGGDGSDKQDDAVTLALEDVEGKLGATDGMGDVYFEGGVCRGGGGLVGAGVPKRRPVLGACLLGRYTSLHIIHIEEDLIQEKRKGRQRTGSKMPAPGHTRSKPPNSLEARANAALSCCQSFTSVLWNTARACLLLPFSSRDDELCVISDSASGRRVRSATTTLQLQARRSLVNSRQIPEPPPVTSAVLPETWRAILVALKCKQQ